MAPYRSPDTVESEGPVRPLHGADGPGGRLGDAREGELQLSPLLRRAGELARAGAPALNARLTVVGEQCSQARALSRPGTRVAVTAASAALFNARPASMSRHDEPAARATRHGEVRLVPTWPRLRRRG